MTDETEVLREIVKRFLGNWEPDTSAQTWQQVHWSVGNPPERSIDRMTAAERDLLNALAGETNR